MRGGKTSYDRDLTKARGWKVGDPIDNLTKAGNEPSWSTVRARYWKNLSYHYGHRFSGQFLERMRKGKPPIHPRYNVPMELHHKKGRNIPNPHRRDNLVALWPWKHDEVDKFRHYNGPRPEGY